MATADRVTEEKGTGYTTLYKTVPGLVKIGVVPHRIFVPDGSKEPNEVLTDAGVPDEIKASDIYINRKENNFNFQLLPNSLDKFQYQK